ncbi:MAG: hypothetical protein V1922_01875 [bacterium]
MRRIISFLILSVFFSLQILPYMPSSIQDVPLVHTLKRVSFFNPAEIDASGLSSASATLANPRLSFHALVNTTIPIGGTVAITKASGAGGDYDTRNLFPLDDVKIDANAAISVASVSSDLVTFTLKTPLVSAGNADTNMTVAQSGTLTVRFTTAAAIPSGGSIKISIPAPASGGNDGIPISAATVPASGFDTNGMTGSNITCPAGFNAAAVTTGTGGTAHVITCDNPGGAFAAGANITFVIGTGANPLVNPAPTTGRLANQRGVADVYSISAGTYSGTAGTGTVIEDIQMKAAPVEGVLVTATVDETLSFTVAGVNAGAGTFCGLAHTAGITTTATSVPWGTIGSGYVIDKNEAVQQLIVTTNAAGGYKVYAEENDQMGLEGATCTGTGPSAGEYTFGTSTCIRDVGVGSVSHIVAADWGATPGTNYGFGYSLQNNTGSDAKFVFNTTGVHDSKQFADQQGLEDKYATNAELMSSGGPVDASAIYVCYRINIPGVQPAGYYFNKIKYTAVPKF